MIHEGINLHSRNMTLIAINDNGKLLIKEKLTNIPANPEQSRQRCREQARKDVILPH